MMHDVHDPQSASAVTTQLHRANSLAMLGGIGREKVGLTNRVQRSAGKSLSSLASIVSRKGFPPPFEMSSNAT